MTIEEAISYYYNRKNSPTGNERLTKNEIRAQLKENPSFNPDDVTYILRRISDLELEQIQNRKSAIEVIMDKPIVSYFFMVFAIAVIITSIFVLQENNSSPITTVLPYIMILGAIFIFGKHLAKVRAAKQKNLD